MRSKCKVAGCSRLARTVLIMKTGKRTEETTCYRHKIDGSFRKNFNDDGKFRKNPNGAGRNEVQIRKTQREHSWRKLGLDFTVEDYNTLFLKQQGKCAICEEHQSEFNRSLAVDHNHQTGEVRGLLCSACNLVVGKIEGKRDFIKSCVAYLGASVCES